MTSEKRQVIVAVLVLLLLGALAFGRSLDNDFINWDDPIQILGNPLVQRLSIANTLLIFRSTVVRQYHPLVTLCYAIEYRFWGADPLPYHLLNLLLHLANGLLVFRLFYRLRGCCPLSSGRLFAAFFGGIFFLLNPLQVQPVAWVSGRKDLLYAFFYLSSILAYLNYRKTGKRSYYDLALLWGLCSLLSKAVAVTLPLVLLLCDYYLGRRLSGKVLLEKVPFLFLSLAIGVAALVLQCSWLDEVLIASRYVWKGAFISASPIVFYLTKAFFPVHLSPFYPFPAEPDFLSPGNIFSAAVLLAVAVLFFSRLPIRPDRRRSLVFGSLFSLITILPVSRIIPFAGMEIVALRFMYLPLVGISYLLTAALADFRFPGKKGRTVLVSLLVAVGSFVLLDAAKCRTWESSEVLWRETIEYQPEFDMAHSNLGSACYYRGDYERAIEHCGRAIEINADMAYSYVVKGLAQRELGDLAAAEKSFREAIVVLERLGSPGDVKKVEHYLKDLPVSDATEQIN